jgi:beta-glucosidase
VDLSGAQNARFFGKGALAKGWRLRVAHAGTTSYFTNIADAKNSSLTITAVDHKAQEDAWKYDWVADGASSVAFVSPQALDLGRETNGDVLLVMTLRIDAPPPGETALFVECGKDCGAHVLVGKQLALLPANHWARIGIRLKCFATAGADMSKLTAAAGIESAAGFKLAISEVSYGTVADHLLSCDQP